MVPSTGPMVAQKHHNNKIPTSRHIQQAKHSDKEDIVRTREKQAKGKRTNSNYNENNEQICKTRKDGGNENNGNKNNRFDKLCGRRTKPNKHEND